jgi:predicted HAD superfamily Cof-like phosphohydrolase
MVKGLEEIIADNKAAVDRWRREHEGHWMAMCTGTGLTDLQKAVHTFKQKAMQTTNIQPSVVDEDSLNLCLKLVVEECDELRQACEENDAIGVADGIGDLVYTAVGVCCLLGIDFAELMRRICASNASKFLEGHQFREDGKLLKSPLYQPVDLADLVHESKKVR